MPFEQLAIDFIKLSLGEKKVIIFGIVGIFLAGFCAAYRCSDHRLRSFRLAGLAILLLLLAFIAFMGYLEFVARVSEIAKEEQILALEQGRAFVDTSRSKNRYLVAGGHVMSPIPLAFLSAWTLWGLYCYMKKQDHPETK